MTARLDSGLDQLQPRSKAGQLRALMPLIRAKLAEGVQHADILRQLNAQGLELTERTYQSYLYRFRKKDRLSGKPQTLAPPPPSLSSSSAAAAVAAPAPAAAAITPVGRRPPTFHFDPKGDPELLR